MIMYHQPWVRAAKVHAPLRGVHPQSEKGKVGSRGKEYLLNWSFVYRRDGVAEEDGLWYCNRGIILQVNPSGAGRQHKIPHGPSGSTAAWFQTASENFYLVELI